MANCIYFIERQDFIDNSCKFLNDDILEMIDRDMNFVSHVEINQINYRFV